MNANKFGKELEQNVEDHFKKFRIRTVSYKKFIDMPYLYMKCLIKNVPYTNVFGLPGKTEFVWHDEFKDIDVRIECKRQSCSRSKQECLAFFIDSCDNMPEKNIYLIMTGDGWQRGLKESVERIMAVKSILMNKKLRLFKNIDEFKNLVEKTYK